MMMGSTSGLFLSPTSTLSRKTPTPLINNYKPYSLSSSSSSSSSFRAHDPTTSANNGVGITTKVEGKSENSTKGDGYDEVYLKRAGLRPDRMPKHVAVTLDGNRVWSRKHNNGELTYEQMYRGYYTSGQLCIKFGIPAATWFVFATCTWKRTHEANNLMFRQLQESLEENLENFVRDGIKVSIIGDKWKLPKCFQDAYSKVEEATKNGKTLHMMYAVSYGGRDDILEAARSISRKVMEGVIEPEDIDEDMVESHLSTRICQVPNPDLMIRTGGHKRISNFFLWQASHAELYFCDTLPGDFGEPQFLQALRSFQHCERRFGK